MDYEVMWNELKGIIQERFNSTLDDIPKYTYENVLDNIKKLEEAYCGNYICIKDYRGIKKGTRCDIIDQTQEDIMVQVSSTEYYEYISYEDFNTYFKEVELN